MKNFGFSLTHSRQLDPDTYDSRLLNYVLETEKSFVVCMYCGSCTASCSAGNLIEFNVRKINLYLRRGDLDLLAKEVDKCMLCGKCTLVCPRDINIRNTIMLIKKGLTILKEMENGRS